MSSSDARATRSIRGWASGITEAPVKRAFSLFWNWNLRYFAQRSERLKGVSAGIWDMWLVCIFWESRGSVKMKEGAKMHKHSNCLAADKRTNNSDQQTQATEKTSQHVIYEWTSFQHASPPSALAAKVFFFPFSLPATEQKKWPPEAGRYSRVSFTVLHGQEIILQILNLIYHPVALCFLQGMNLFSPKI